MARVLVTGATGCLGAEITAQLLNEGHEVRAMGRDLTAGRALQGSAVEFIARDLRDPRPWDDVLAGIETIHHCAALSSAWGRPEEFDAINVSATRRLLVAATNAGVKRFIFTSSPSIYADGTDRLNLTESASLPSRFATAYAASKATAERLVLAADDPAGMRCTALRPRAIYGRGDRALMPRLLQAMRRGRVPMIAGGRAMIDLTHVSDAARAHLLAARHAERAGGRVFNVTSGQAYSFATLLDVVSDWTGLSPARIPLPYPLAMSLASGLEAAHRLFRPSVEPVLTRQAVASLGRSLTLDITAARRDLEYKPEVTFAEGIRDYAR